MSNNPLRALTSEGLSTDTAAAVDAIKARLVASPDVSKANAIAMTLSEIVEQLKTLA